MSPVTSECPTRGEIAGRVKFTDFGLRTPSGEIAGLVDFRLLPQNVQEITSHAHAQYSYKNMHKVISTINACKIQFS